jgi:DNA-binding transcriptional ArsR family regulator
MEYKPKIVMTQDEFRVLASTTRIDIMKLLDESQLTVSDVSRRLEMNKATVHEHLNKLIEVGLVKKEDTTRKWVYYSLTWKGRNLLHPERVKVMVALATIAIAVVIVGLIIAMQGATVPLPGQLTAPPPSVPDR